jgi:TonB family protein
MKNYFLATLFIVNSVFLVFSQKTVYFDSDWKKTKKRKASYYREISKTDNFYAIKDYFMNGSIQMTGAYKDSKTTIKTGPFVYYDSSRNVVLKSHFTDGKLSGKFERLYPNGNVRQVKFYVDNKQNGPYQEFYPNGQLRAEGNYSMGKFIGEWKRFYETGEPLIIMNIDSQGSGKFKSLHINGLTQEEGEFIERNSYGIWTLKDNNGNIVQSKECGFETPFVLKDYEAFFSPNYVLNDEPDNNIIEFPEREAKFIGGNEALAQYIASSVNYPEKAIKKEIADKIFVSFVVEVDGSISNVKIIKGHKLLREETIRVVQNMPKWYPGESNGKKARTRCKLPINYTLN